MFMGESDLLAKEELIHIINGVEFKELFLQFNITNVIIFGSITKDSFSCESDVDIAIISQEKLSFSKELKLIQSLEKMLKREIDLIDINDSDVNNMIKISALNSKWVVFSDKLLEEKIEYYDNLCKENEEFWSRLDRVVLGFE